LASKRQPTYFLAARRSTLAAICRRKKKQFLKKWVTEHMEESEARATVAMTVSSSSSVLSIIHVVAQTNGIILLVAVTQHEVSGKQQAQILLLHFVHCRSTCVL